MSGRRRDPLCLVLALLFAAGSDALDGQPPARAEPGVQQRPPAPPAAKTARRAAPAATSLDVSVSDPAGKPVAGALVVVVPSEGAFSPWGAFLPERTRSLVTGTDGKARLTSLPAGPWTVMAYRRGFTHAPQRRVTAGPVTVRLEKGGTISGVVRDGERRPLAGARVAVAGVRLPGDWQEDLARNEATTDADGRFRLEGIGRSPVLLSARASGFGRAERRNVSAGASVEIFLFPGATLSGSVRDDAGQPVKGAVVRAEGDRPWESIPPERTDAAGEFVIAGVAPGEYTLVAREGGRAPAVGGAIVPADGEATVPLVLSDGGYATGRIVDSDGGPLAGRARVETIEDRGLPEFAKNLLAASARADGVFTLGPLPLGTLGIELSASGHAARRVEAEIAGRGRTAELGDVALERGLALRGRVRDRTGNGVAEVKVRAEAERSAGASEGEASTAASGDFEIGGLKAGRHRVTAKAPGYAEARGNSEPGGPPLELVLDAGGEITGRVADETGRGVPEARVRLEESVEQRQLARFHFALAEEGDGRFVLRDVAPGSYALLASAEGRGEASLTDVRVVAGRPRDVGTLTLARGGVVVGVVVDGEGRGVPGASISVERDANQRTGGFSTQSGSNGGFELRGVPIGPVHVFARHPSFAEAPPVVTEVDPEKDPAPVRLVLQRGGRIEGRALHRDGSPFAGGRVSFHSLDQAGAGMRFEMPAIAPDGSFVVEHVPAGRILLTLMAFTPGSPMASGSARNVLTSVASREMLVRDGETSEADLVLRDVVVAGRVTKAGQPAPGVRVDVMSTQHSSMMIWAGPVAAATTPSGPPLLGCTTRDDGSYELLVFAPGPAMVQLRGPSQTHPGRAVEIPDLERYELDFELGGAVVAGMVVDKAGGAPVADAGVSLWRTDGDSGGPGGGGASSGPDGRFSVAVEPGEYRLEARATGRQRATLNVSVGQAGVSDLRVELEAGLEITGRLVDASGRPAPGFNMLATLADGDSAGYTHTNSLPDGTFRIGGLGPKACALVAGSELAGFAFAAGVMPGGEPLTLALRPAGRITVKVVDEAGLPVKDAWTGVEAIDGARARVPGVTRPTGVDGLSVIASPAGSVDVEVRSEKGRGRGTVAVAAGGVAAVTIASTPAPAP